MKLKNKDLTTENFMVALGDICALTSMPIDTAWDLADVQKACKTRIKTYFEMIEKLQDKYLPKEKRDSLPPGTHMATVLPEKEAAEFAAEGVKLEEKEFDIPLARLIPLQITGGISASTLAALENKIITRVKK